MHLSASPSLWYAVRASGVAAYVLITAAVVVGISLAGRARVPHWPRFAVDELHRYLGTLFWVFLGVHVVGTAVDSFLPFSVADLVVPFAGSFRPLGMGLGIAATELLLALAVANRLRGRLSYAFWRRTHYLNLLVWLGSTVHSVAAGTDHAQPWLALLYAGCTSAVVGAFGLRLVARRSPSSVVQAGR